jgi:predicted pyridoxine 5'-phosphate oxidase superfamily flavin-nucleotide-binding protein
MRRATSSVGTPADRTVGERCRTDTSGGVVAIIDSDMRAIVESAKLSFVATVCPDGSPSLSPKASVRVVDDDHLAFMDIASPNTVANLTHDPRIEINSIDFLRRRGYRFKGFAEFREPGDPIHQWLLEWLVTLNGPDYPAHGAILVRVDRALPVVSPAYVWGHAHEDDLVARWSEIYRVPRQHNT